MPGSGKIFKAQGLTLYRQAHCLWSNISLALAPGEAALIRGVNGSGKTSLIQVMAGILSPDAGTIWRGQVCRYVGHRNALIARQVPAAFADALQLRYWGLTPVSHIPIAYLSAGQRRRLALARLTGTQGGLWILDEPTTNLDDEGVHVFQTALKRHLEGGGAAILSAHGDRLRPVAHEIQL